MTKCELGLVTVLFNSEEVLDGFFRSISIQTFKDYHLFLIDNTPSERSDDLINTLTQKYQIVEYTHVKNNQNVGVAKGNNQGIDLSLKSGTTHTLLLNNDIEFDNPDLFKDLIDHARTKSEHLIIPKILFYDTKKIWMAGGKFVLYKGITNHRGEGEVDGPLYDQEGHYNYAPTCFMLINNDVFKQVGIMDENYFVYYDDTDFLYRAFQKGYSIKYLPKLCVLHKVSSSTGGNDSPFSIYYFNRNRIYFIRKNFRGLQYATAMGTTLITRVLKYAINRSQRKNVIRAVKDGFNIKI